MAKGFECAEEGIREDEKIYFDELLLLEDSHETLDRVELKLNTIRQKLSEIGDSHPKLKDQANSHNCDTKLFNYIKEHEANELRRKLRNEQARMEMLNGREKVIKDFMSIKQELKNV